MITINGRVFVRTKTEAVQSLFNPGGTVTGYYRLVKGGVVLMDLQRNPKAAAYSSRHGSGIVNCSRLKNGRMYYQYALGTLHAAWLGIDDNSPRANTEAAENLLSQLQ